MNFNMDRKLRLKASVIFVLAAGLVWVTSSVDLRTMLESYDPLVTEEIPSPDDQKLKLTGSIPSQIGRFTKLKMLKLGGKGLNGTLPLQFGRLNQLTYLDIAHNQLRGPSPISDQFAGNFDKLEYLNFQSYHARWDNPYNKMTGSISSEIGRMDKLTFLEAQVNKLGGSIPTQIGRLERLRRIHFGFCDLGGRIPTEIGKLKELTWLWIGVQGLIGPIPEEISRLTKLTVLELGVNRLTGPLPKGIGNLDRLRMFSVSNNRRHTGTIPSQMGKLTQLTQLRLEDNMFSGTLPNQLSNLQSLQFMALGQNNFELSCTQEFVRWYNPFSEKFISDRHDLNLRCQDGMIFPFWINVTLNNHAEIQAIESFPASRKVKLRWTYEKDIESRDFQVDVHNHGLEKFKSCFTFAREAYADRGKYGEIPTSHEVKESVGFKIVLHQQNKDADKNDVIGQYCIKYSQTDLNYLDGVFEFTLPVSLKPATVYEFSMAPIDVQRRPQIWGYKFRDGAYTPPFRFKTLDDIPGSAPVGIRLNDRTDTAIALQWDDVSDANSETVEYLVSVLNCDRCTKIEPVDGTSVSINGLNPGTLYNFAIQAKNSAGVGPKGYISIETCSENTYSESSEGFCEIAEAGYFLLESTGVAASCSSFSNEVEQEQCVESRGMNAVDLILKSGYWRPNIDSMIGIKVCPRPEFCVTNINNVTDLELISDRHCARNHTGVYCSYCLSEYTLSPAGCIICDETDKQVDQQKVIAIVFLVILLIVLYQLKMIISAGLLSNVCTANQTSGVVSSCGIKKSMQTCVRAYNKQISTKIKIFVVTTQILFSFQHSLSTKSPSDIGRKNLLTSVITMELEEITSVFGFSCYAEIGFYNKLLFITLFPLSVVSFIWIVYALVNKYVLEKEKVRAFYQEVFSFFVLVTFFVYAPVSQTIVETFLCETIELKSGSVDYLIADYTIRCDSEQHVQFLVYSSVMIVIFPVSILGMYIYLLNNRRKLFLQRVLEQDVTDETEKERLKLVEFLTHPYKDYYYWFEIYELIRKLLMTTFVAVAVAKEGDLNTSFTGEAYAFIVVMVSILILEVTRPYKNLGDWLYSFLSLLVLGLASQISTYSKIWARNTVASIVAQAEKEALMFSVLFWLEFCIFLLFIVIEPILSYCKVKSRENTVKDVAVDDNNKRCLNTLASNITEGTTIDMDLILQDESNKMIEKLKSELMELKRTNRQLEKQSKELLEQAQNTIQTFERTKSDQILVHH